MNNKLNKLKKKQEKEYSLLHTLDKFLQHQDIMF